MQKKYKYKYTAATRHLNEHPVSLEVPVLTEEPSRVHVESPGRPAPGHKVTGEVVLLALVDALEVLLQHVKHLGGVLNREVVMRNTANAKH
jgi:hypothetical protein